MSRSPPGVWLGNYHSAPPHLGNGVVQRVLLNVHTNFNPFPIPLCPQLLPMKIEQQPSGNMDDSGFFSIQVSSPECSAASFPAPLCPEAQLWLMCHSVPQCATALYVTMEASAAPSVNCLQKIRHCRVLHVQRWPQDSRLFTLERLWLLTCLGQAGPCCLYSPRWSETCDRLPLCVSRLKL